MKNWFKSFFEESPGVGSMARLNVFLCFVFCVACPVVVEVGLALTSKDGKWPEIPTGLSYFLGGLFASATGFKILQAVFGEKPPASP